MNLHGVLYITISLGNDKLQLTKIVKDVFNAMFVSTLEFFLESE